MEASGVCFDIVSGVGLRRSLRYHADRLNRRSAHAAVLAFGLGAGQIAGASHKEDPSVCMLGSGGQAGLLVTVYFIYHAPGWLRGLGALRSQTATSKMSHVLISYSSSAAIIDSMMLEPSSLVMAKLFLPASFSDAPIR